MQHLHLIMAAFAAGVQNLGLGHAQPPAELTREVLAAGFEMASSSRVTAYT